MEDLINHPQHYEKHAVTVRIEPIDLVERCGFLLGNTLKYCFRWQDKGTPLLDLKKARYYVNRLLCNRYDTSINDGVAPAYLFEFFASEGFIAAYLLGDTEQERLEGLKCWIDDKILQVENAIHGD